jgi:hypothetical protein
MMDELEPLSPQLQALLDAEKPVSAAPAAAKARLLARLSADLFDGGAGDGGDGGDGGGGAPDGGAGGASGAGTSASGAGTGASSGAGPSASGAGTGASSGAGASASGAAGASATGASGVTAGAATAGVSAGAATGTGAIAGATGAASAGLSTAGGVLAKALVVKLVVGSSVASLVVGGAIGAGVHSVVVTAKEAPARVAPTEGVGPPARPAPEPVVEAPPPPPLVEVPKPVEVAPAPKVAPVVAPKLSADEQLALEKSYLEQARAAMARNDADSALSALAQHAKGFPKGQLTEERMALEVMALSSAGRSIEAKNAANAFRARFPEGLFRSAVDAVSPP